MQKSKTYTVKEIFYSIQGEGYYSGTPCVFVRFSGCNLWNGKVSSKKDSPCWFCDTNFVGGDKLSCEDIFARVQALLPEDKEKRVVFTGGEPFLQLDDRLVEYFSKKHFSICVETNGTIDKKFKYPVWVTCSPKTEVLLSDPDEIKLLHNNGVDPKAIYDRFKFSCKYFYLQPIDNIVTKEYLDFILNNDSWRMSLQLHKIIGVE